VDHDRAGKARLSAQRHRRPAPADGPEVEFIENDIDAAVEQAKQLVEAISEPLALPGHG
jgi:hypothetical protein